MTSKTAFNGLSPHIISPGSSKGLSGALSSKGFGGGSERRPKMTSKTMLHGIKHPYFLEVVCPTCDPKKVAIRVLQLVPVAP